jgi:hypothetical protein
VEKKEAMMSPANNCVTKDEAEAMKWYRKAAEQGYANAQSSLGFMYDLGRGVKQDDKEAVKWWKGVGPIKEESSETDGPERSHQTKKGSTSRKLQTLSVSGRWPRSGSFGFSHLLLPARSRVFADGEVIDVKARAAFLVLDADEHADLLGAFRDDVIQQELIPAADSIFQVEKRFARKCRLIGRARSCARCRSLLRRFVCATGCTAGGRLVSV